MAQAVVPPPDGGYPGQNTAEGQSALLHLAGGTYNTALGWASLGFNVTGNYNTGVGAATLLNNTAAENTATGAGALLSNTTGVQNTANGAFALFGNTQGNGNTASGVNALFSNTFVSSHNTAIGEGALLNNTTGSYNTALGQFAGFNITTANDVICIGHPGQNGDHGCYIGNIRGALLTADPLPVLIDNQGRLGTISGSSSRFKKEIRPMDKASGSILALKPVTFRYKTDNTNTPQFGLIAEEVAEVNPDLVVRGENGDVYTVRYDAVNAMLLNEFLKEHRRVEELESTVAKQEAAIAEQHRSFQRKLTQQETQIEALTSGLEKVSTQIEMMKPATQIVVNEP